MLIIKKSFTILSAAALLAATGCQKLEDFNDNPNATTSAPINALLTNVEAGLGSYGFQTTPGYYCQYFSQTQYTSESNYSTPQADFNGTYSGSLEDMQNITDNAANNSNNMVQVAKIVKNYLYWTITDRWGDVPYTQALKGGSGNNAYDPQEIIYKGMLAEVTEAVNSFDATSPITGDLMNNNDVALWKKTGNSLRMLMALRLSKRYPAAGDYAATEFSAAMTADGGYIADNTSNFKIAYPTSSAAFKNPIYVNYDGRKDNAETTTMTNLLGNLGDGRIAVYGGLSELPSSVDPNWNVTSAKGFPYGLNRDPATTFINANPDWARVLRGDFRLPQSPIYLITAAQVNFAIAEAIDRGWVSGDMNTFYTNGINASFSQYGLIPAASYFTQSGVALSAPAGSAANLKNLSIQRYIATYPDGLQGWSDWRRTGYPELTPTPTATNDSKQIPRRYTYGTGEYGSNNANTKAAAAAIGSDSQDTHVWWDK